MPAPKEKTPKLISHIDVRYVHGSLPPGEFVGGLPLDGSTISAPAALAEAWIAAGIATRVNAALAVEADKETE